MFTHPYTLFMHICALFTHICDLFTHLDVLFLYIYTLFTRMNALLGPWNSWIANSDKKYMELYGAALNVNKPCVIFLKTAFPKDK